MIDVCIIGAGLAGLSVASRLPSTLSTVIVTDSPSSGNSWLAQGGIAAAFQPHDSVSAHLEDTIHAGAKHVNIEGARALVSQGAHLIEELLAQGFPADRTQSGSLSVGREAAHSQARIIHAGGDQTGRVWMQHIASLTATIPKLTNRGLHSLLVEEGRCIGVRLVSPSGELESLYAKHIVLATGGIGGLFEITSNCNSAVGTGLSAAFHAGAKLADLEFVQFHPTIAVEGNSVLGLITEAIRGAGAYFTTEDGTPLPIAALATRDHVARQVETFWQQGIPVYLDVSAIQELADAFPTVFQTLQRYTNEKIRQTRRIPVRPGAHFHMGGILTDLDGRTSLSGLYAAGEVACTGVHGANRLASNSLLECIVMGDRVAHAIANDRVTLSPIEKKPTAQPPEQLSVPSPEQMTQLVGVTRSLHVTQFANSLPVEMWELQQVSGSRISDVHRYTVMSLLAQAASLRTESRGAHFREDHPTSEDHWQGRVLTIEGNTISYENRQVDYLKARILQ